MLLMVMILVEQSDCWVSKNEQNNERTSFVRVNSRAREKLLNARANGIPSHFIVSHKRALIGKRARCRMVGMRSIQE